MVTQGRVILDLRGLLLHSYYSGTPLDYVFTEKGDRRPKAEHGIDQFIRLYMQPILENNSPIDIIAVQEGQGSNSRRRAWLSKYKERPSQDEESEIVQQELERLYNYARKLLLGLGCMMVKTPYAEADDTIAYLVERLKGGKIIHTVDNDLLQLVRPNDNSVAVIVKGKFSTQYKGMALQPHNPVRMYKSICGDSSDGYVGVRGVGDKAWEQLVENYGLDGIAELEEIVKHENFSKLEEVINETGDKTLQKLYEQRSEWSTAYKLASLHPEWCETNYGDKVIRPKWEKRVPTIERLREALEPLGLSYWVEQFKKFTTESWLLDANRYARTKKEQLVGAMRKSRFIAFDYESYDALKHPGFQEAKRGGGYVDVLNQKITGCSFAFGDNLQFCFYMPIKHRDTYNCKLDDLKDMFGSLEGRDLIAHNAMFEMSVSKTNMELEFPYLYDTLIMSNYVDENTQHGLKFLSKHWLNYNQTNYSDIVPAEKDMRDVSGSEVLQYGCDDSIVTAHMAVLFKTIMECEQTWDFYEENEIYFEKAMLDGFIKGIPMDYTRLKELQDEDQALYDKTDAEMRALLEQHCSEINEDGFNRLWVEIEMFEQKSLAEKEKSAEEIAEILHEKKTTLRPLCKYNPIRPPIMEAKKTHIVQIAKALNLPAIRSLKQEWIQTYWKGIHAQLEEGATASEEQLQFVDLLHTAVMEGNEDAALTLEGWMNNFVANDKSLWSGDQLSARSPKQMAELFYGKMGLPILVRNSSIKGKKTKREVFELEGAPSTNENAIRTWLTELDKDDWRYRVLDCVLTLRGINTRFSLYYRPYPLWKSPVDERIHPQIRNFGTVTGRPSGTSPNVLQVSKTKDEGHTRGVFLPQSADKTGVEPEVIVSIDFVQQELVILAGESGDENLRACYTGPMETRKDVHTSTALTIFKIRNPHHAPVDYGVFIKMAKDENKQYEENTVSDLTKRPYDIRKVYAKRTNFLASYGGGPSGLARKLIVPKDVATEFLDSFFGSYPKVKDYQERCARQAIRHGFVTTCFGTRRHLYMIHDKNKAVAKSAERQAGNMPIQGGAANVLKIVMREFVKRDVARKTGCTLYAPIYDELVLSCPISMVYELIEMLADIMEMELPGLNIKLDTSVSIGKNWGEQIEIGSRPSKEKVEKTIQKIFEEQSQEAA
jgi:DNA polymerase I-like protein with 3'-5' exonuclease and polymerase domains/5'-3' exonuclease